MCSGFAIKLYPCRPGSVRVNGTAAVAITFNELIDLYLIRHCLVSEASGT